MTNASAYHEESLGRLLLDHSEELVARWLERWRREVPSSADASEAELRDLVPRQLNVIAHTLLSGGYRTEPPRKLWEVDDSRLNPEDRVSQNIPIENLVQEYWLLVSTIRDWLEEQGLAVSFEEFTYFYEAVFELIAQSVRRYSAFQAELTRSGRCAYLAGLAHQMRNHLSVLSMGLARLQSSARLPERLLGAMRRNLDRLTLEVEGVLRLERYSGEDLPVRPDCVHPRALIDEILFGVEGEASAKGIVIDVQVDQDAELCADPDLLYDTLANLIQNAAKYTERGTIRIQMDEGDREVRFCVVDTGPGVDELRRAELFKPVLSAKRGGAGIGLTVAARSIRAQGGEIGVESTPGEGATFWFTLPKPVEIRG